VQARDLDGLAVGTASAVLNAGGVTQPGGIEEAV
jgi:hypothetical protein